MKDKDTRTMTNSISFTASFAISVFGSVGIRLLTRRLQYQQSLGK